VASGLWDEIGKTAIEIWMGVRIVDEGYWDRKVRAS
jgi:hypothetical protein